MTNFKKLHINDNHFLAYSKFVPEAEKKKFPIGVIFLSGFMSDMEGSKAVFLENLCRKINIPFIRFDYMGCGKSSGDFIDGTISHWKDDSLNIIESFTEVEQIVLVGSSMGGWLMLLCALHLKDYNRIAALLGIASAPDFTEDLIWQELSEQAKQEINESGQHKMSTEYCGDPNAEDHFYIITKDLIEDGRKNMLLSGDIIDINIPVTLLHGMKDEDVPYEYSMILQDKISAKNITTILQKEGTHRMSEAEDLALIEESLTSLIGSLKNE